MTARQRPPYEALEDFQTAGKRQVLFKADVCAACEQLRADRPQSWAQLVAAAIRYVSGEAMGGLLRDEGRRKYGDGDKKVHLLALGGHGFRVYGFVKNLDGKETFIGVMATEKKQTKADQELLKRSAKACKPFIEG